MISLRATHLVAAAMLSVPLAEAHEERDAAEARADAVTTIAVAGSGEDHLTTAIVHSQETTPTGKIQKGTETVELRGDLKGFVLYHVTSVFDFGAGTLVNTGDQVFSGTVAGSAPVMIHAHRDSSESVPASTTRRVSKDTVSRDTASLREDGGGEQTRLHLRRFSKQEVLRATSISLSRDAGGERGDVRGCARAR